MLFLNFLIVKSIVLYFSIIFYFIVIHNASGDCGSFLNLSHNVVLYFIIIIILTIFKYFLLQLNVCNVDFHLFAGWFSSYSL